MSLFTSLTVRDNYLNLIKRPSLEVCLDAIDSPNTRDANNNVTLWSDISGNGNHAQQVGSDAMPVYVANKDGFPAIYSDGTTGRKLDFSHNVTNNDALTVIALFQPDSSITDPSTGSSLNVVFAFGGADSGDDSMALRQLSSNVENLSFVGYGGGSSLNGNPYSNFEAFSITFDGTNILCHYGETLETDSDYAASSTRILGNGRLFNENPENTARTGIGWLRSVVLYKEALDDETRNAIINAMKSRYGIL